MRTHDRYITIKSGHCHYHRRVPRIFKDYDPRKVVRASLRTRSMAVARERRDRMEDADNEYWASLVGIDLGEASPAEIKALRATIEKRYKTACIQAVAKGAAETPWHSVLRDLALGRLADHLIDSGVQRGRAAGAYGGPPEISQAAPATISQAQTLYLEKIAVPEQVNKSAEQRIRWRQAKGRAIRNLIEVIGDKPMAAITRDDALRYYGWWGDRFRVRLGGKGMSSVSANREIGIVTKFYREFFAYFGDYDRINPFQKLCFKPLKARGERPSMPDDWVRERILRPGVLDGMNPDLRKLLFVLIETGCRTSEAANLMARDIILDTDAPYIRIRPRLGREVKSASAVRDIPLVGVALEAMQRAPEGFPKLRDATSGLSAYLLNFLRDRELMPTEEHVIYSFRHSFERRMLEAGLDFELRCRLMGHAAGRPKYGNGGSMAYRRDQLLKVAHPFSMELFRDL